MKLLSTRTGVLMVLILLLLFGLMTFSYRYMNKAAVWAQHPTNSHFYLNGQLRVSGAVYDRTGNILFQTADGITRYNTDKTIRTALMHTTGDRNANVATGAQVVFGDHLTGWDMLNGAYRFNNRIGSGSNLTLTIDADLSAAAYRELNGRKGAVGVYNYKTGDILAMVSSPSFDPENPPDIHADPKTYEGVYMNRLISAAYTPGSIFKLVTTAAAIEGLDGIENTVYLCEGNLEIGPDRVTCPSVHGEVTLKDALAKSCNVAFAQIAMELGGAALQKYAELAGFNSSLEVNGIRTAVGKVNAENAVGADLAWAGIGQFTNTANPLSFMAFMGAIANEGIRITPRILQNDGLLTSIKGNKEKQVLTEETAVQLADMMRNNTIRTYGEQNFKGLELAAKSGTAQVGEEKKPHAWFAGFLNRDDFPLAFVVILENGGTGSRTAAAVAANVLQYAVRIE